MEYTASDGLPCYPAAPASALLDDEAHHHKLYVDPAAATTSFFPSTTDAQAEAQPPPPATEPRKPRKRARASRRALTTVLTTDATNFRAMVQEFTGIPAPSFAPHLGLSPGVLFGARPSPFGSVGGSPFHHQLLRPSSLKLSASLYGPPRPPSCTTGNTSSFAHTLLEPRLSSESYGRFSPTFAAGAVPSYGEGFAAAMAGEGVEHGHGLSTSFLHAEDRYHGH